MIQRLVVECWPQLIMAAFMIFGWWLLCNEDLYKVERVSRAIAMLGTQIVLFYGGFWDKLINFHFFGG